MSPLGIILVIFAVLFLFGGLGGGYAPWSYGYGFGHGGIGILGLLLIVVVVLALLGRL